MQVELQVFALPCPLGCKTKHTHTAPREQLCNRSCSNKTHTHCSYAARWGAIWPEVGETERLQGFRRDPLWVKIREVGRGLSLADTQTGR